MLRDTLASVQCAGSLQFHRLSVCIYVPISQDTITGSWWGGGGGRHQQNTRWGGGTWQPTLTLSFVLHIHAELQSIYINKVLFGDIQQGIWWYCVKLVFLTYIFLQNSDEKMFKTTTVCWHDYADTCFCVVKFFILKTKVTPSLIGPPFLLLDDFCTFWEFTQIFTLFFYLSLSLGQRWNQVSAVRDMSEISWAVSGTALSQM